MVAYIKIAILTEKIKTFCFEGCFFWVFVCLSRNNPADMWQIHKMFSCCWIYIFAKKKKKEKAARAVPISPSKLLQKLEWNGTD